MSLKTAAALVAGSLALFAAFRAPAGTGKGAAESAVLVLLVAVLLWAARELRSAAAGLPRRRFLVLLAVLAAAPRLAWIAAVRNGQLTDFAIYDELARALVSGQGYAVTGEAGRLDLVYYLGQEKPELPYRTSYRPPGTAFIGAALYRLLGVDPLWMKLLNALLGTLIAFALYSCASRAGLEPAARLAALGWALYPSAIFATNLFGSEIPFTAALAALAWALSRAEAGARARDWAAMGLLAAAACLVRPMWLPIATAVAYACWSRGGTRSAAVKLAVFLAFLALGLSPWAWRNTRLWGRFTSVCTDGGMVLAYHTAYLLPPSAAQDPVRLERVRRWRSMRNESEQDAEGYAIALDNLGAVLRAGPFAALRALAYCFSSTFAGDDEILHWATLSASNVRVLSRRAVFGLSRVNFAFYFSFWLLALRGIWRQRFGWASLPDGARFLGVNFLATWALFMLIPGQDRYHFSLMPAVLLWAGIGAAPATGIRRPVRAPLVR